MTRLLGREVLAEDGYIRTITDVYKSLIKHNIIIELDDMYTTTLDLVELVSEGEVENV